MRILIAEDDSILADGLSRSLRHNGYAVDAVRDGLAADSALAAQPFDLLILDLGLPQLTGLEVLRRLRARNSVLPVLILTAADSIEQRVKGLDLGADDYMAKPFALSELEARVRALTRRGAGGGALGIGHGRLTFDQTGPIDRVLAAPLRQDLGCAPTRDQADRRAGANFCALTPLTRPTAHPKSPPPAEATMCAAAVKHLDKISV